ncbi:hypothetical protein FGG08_002468 [Glutinoglossum americanum]|uniref:RRM domain-containing protein n=1 Tax=Glutinoglossum americanum TaxID=1670608 RepID=A0A9P8IBL5_9PEZI|nr:hypothetical protein FGG08_002468 [Glutinoglossum americanum]
MVVIAQTAVTVEGVTLSPAREGALTPVSVGDRGRSTPVHGGYISGLGSVQQQRGAGHFQTTSSDAYAYPIEGPFEEGTAMHTIHPHSARFANHNRKLSYASSAQQQSMPLTAGNILGRAKSMSVSYHKRRISFPTSGLYTQPIAPIDQYSSTIPGDGSHSQQYQMLFNYGVPTVDYAIGNRPFVDMARQVKVPMWGVIKIGNIPYTVTKPEVMAFLGRSAKLITPDMGCPIHIIMERGTSKTMDCYVEFLTVQDARSAVQRFVDHRDTGRHPRIGERHVDMEMSTQSALMMELFPKTGKYVTWNGAHPKITRETDSWGGFKAFITSEELVMTIKHADTPHRSPFSAKCPQRVYESMISTISKFPWWVVDMYTLGTRDHLFEATEELVKILMRRIKTQATLQISEQLLLELVETALRAPGFSEVQKAHLVHVADIHMAHISLPLFSDQWIFETICRKNGVADDVLAYYVALLRDASFMVALGEQFVTIPASRSAFGSLTVTFKKDRNSLSMSEASEAEWEVIDGAIRKALEFPASIRESMAVSSKE